MNLYDQLDIALQGPQRGLGILRVLEQAQAAGVPRAEAEKTLNLLLDQLPAERRIKTPENPTTDEDLIVEMLQLVTHFCRPQDYIWPYERKPNQCFQRIPYSTGFLW